MTYDLRVIEILRDLLRPSRAGTEIEARYLDFRLSHGRRPTASEMAEEGFDPARNGHGGWFDFVRDMGDPVDERTMAIVAGLLRPLESDKVIPRDALLALMTLRSGRASDEGLARWALHPLLRREGSRLTLVRPDLSGHGTSMILELVAWRMATNREGQVDDAPEPFRPCTPILWREYMREEIPSLFGAVFNPGNWNAGIVRLDTDLILLTTLHKDGKRAGSDYEDAFVAPDRLTWQTQTQTRRGSRVGQILSGQEQDAHVHLFVRANRLRNGKGAPFLYCGEPQFESWDGEAPITIHWRLDQQVPQHLWRSLGIKEI